jgi:flavin reductase (DIM6/NTAB) family NADH-FMN oxidoreductase RutF
MDGNREGSMLDQQMFKDVMARIPSAVAVITMHSPSGFRGVTVASFGSLSLDPPLAYACINRDMQSHDILMASEWFAFNVLSRGQSFHAEQFSGQTPLADPTFAGVPHHFGETGLPLIDGCVCWFECRQRSVFDGGDHSIFTGEIMSLEHGESDDPLIYCDRKFTELAWS